MACPEVIVCGDYLVFTTVMTDKKVAGLQCLSVNLRRHWLSFNDFLERPAPYREPNSEEVLKSLRVLDQDYDDNADLIAKARVVLRNYIEGV